MQTRRRAATILAGVLVFMALTAEEGCAPSDGSSKPEPKPPAPAAGAQHADPGAAQPAPVQGDPSAHNTQPGELDLSIEWASENKKTPACEWSLNAPGVGQPCANMATPEKAVPNGLYLGLWEHTVSTSAKAGDVVFLTARGNIGSNWVKCYAYWKGQQHAFPFDDGRKQCGGTWTLS
jgi:hypothetical protein